MVITTVARLSLLVVQVFISESVSPLYLKKLSPPIVTPNLKVLHGDGSWVDLPTGSNAWISDGVKISNNPLNARVGIGTSSPTPNFSLDVNGDINLLHNGSGIANGFQIKSGSIPQSRGIQIDEDQFGGNFDFFISNYQDGAYHFKANNAGTGTINHLMTIFGDGGVVIGNGVNNDDRLPGGYKLAVNGKIISEEVNVLLHDTWPDFVFKSNYSLRSLGELKEYIKNNSHLPEIPSSEEISKSGLPLGEIIAKQMQKIEELTLYVLDLQKQIDQLKDQK